MKHPERPLSLQFSLLRLFFLSLVLSSCIADNRQSMIHTATDTANDIAFLWWLMLLVYIAVFSAVMVLLAVGVMVKEKDDAEPPGGSRRWIIIGGIVLPAVTVIVMLFLSLRVTTAMPQQNVDLVVEVTARNWWWDVRYPDHDVTSANEIYLPQGAVVRFDFCAREVIHSFWVPALHGKMDMLPDHVTELVVQAKKTGTFRGVCAEFCGIQHALMALYVVVLSEDEFADWMLARHTTSAEPLNDRQRFGKEVYFEKGCDTCHRIRGTEALGEVGPDLTHIGSRLSLGAATVPYSKTALADFIRNPQAIKPGNAMPETVIDDQSLQALVEYLDALK